MSILHIKQLKKSYLSPDGERTAVVDIPEFRMNQGEQVALEGASGTGKTTFLNLIAGILQADDGLIEVDGQDIVSFSEAQRDEWRAKTLGYVFQTFNLLQGYTALENVMLGMAFGKGIDSEFARSLLKRVRLETHMNHRPRQLSVGQQQRVAVARALANKPKIVLADEPTGNLDFGHAKEAITLIREICKENGAALLLVSHDHDILRKFDKIQKLSDINRAFRKTHHSMERGVRP